MACELAELDLCIRKGDTIRIPLRIETDLMTWAPITDIDQSAPVRITAVDHGLPDEWKAAVVGVKGMKEINADSLALSSAFTRVTVIDDDTIEFNHINAAVFKPYISGGHLVYYTPFDFTIYTGARMQVKDKVGGDELALFTTDDDTLELDNTNKILWINMTAADSAALDFKTAVFDIELVAGSGAVRAICSSSSTITLLSEITTEE
jgi:hypothetical protein